MATTTPATAKAATPKTPAKVSHAKKKTPPKVVAEIHLIPLDRIKVKSQVRTIFDDDSIAELAADIEERGLRQPVEVTPIGDELYLLTLGERRLRAITKLGHKAIAATIVKTSVKNRLVDQLAENIQREDLDLQDEVKAIRTLHDTLGSVAAVAGTVKKSTPWVSKRLALSHPDLSYQARSLMEDGITEDVEILNTLSHLNAISWPAANTLTQQLRAGSATRETARQALKDAKNPKPTVIDPNQAQRERQHAADKADAEVKSAALTKARTEGTGQEFIKWAWAELERACEFPESKGFRSTAFFDKIHHNQRVALRAHVKTLQEEAKARDFKQWAYFASCENLDYDYLELMVGIYTLKGYDIADNLAAFLTMVEDANRPEDEE